jgi:glutathione S-transferase
LQKYFHAIAFISLIWPRLKNIADMINYAWYGILVIGDLYSAQEFLDVENYNHVKRWANNIHARPAVKRGRMVNKAWGAEEEKLLERHSADDFDKNRTFVFIPHSVDD